MTTTIHPPERQVDAESQESIVTRPGVRMVLAVSRVVIGFTFLWAFVDKLLGLGFATPSARAWINGGTPAQGFIKNIEGPFHDVFQVFANPIGDWLFMLALLGIGVAMIAGARSPHRRDRRHAAADVHVHGRMAHRDSSGGRQGRRRIDQPDR